MTEHIELLKKEVFALEKNLEMAKKRPGVRKEEILNIETKIRLKMETAGMLAGMVMAMKRKGGGNEPENT